VVFQLAMRAGVAGHAVLFHLAVQTPLRSHRSRSIAWPPSLRACASSARRDVWSKGKPVVAFSSRPRERKKKRSKGRNERGRTWSHTP
jgi:hypothetical protein